MDNKLKTVDAETLLSTPMSKTMFIVDGLISQGVNVISGASKIGKSWLMLWLGLQVAQGNSIWGLPTLQCDVLYLSLEDTQRRIKDRLYNLTDSAPDNLYFAVTSGVSLTSDSVSRSLVTRSTLTCTLTSDDMTCTSHCTGSIMPCA